MPRDYILKLQDAKRSHTAGRKAENLWFLRRKGFSVPTTYVCTWAAYTRYLEGDAGVLEAIEAELAAKVDPEQEYAVRSSANLEDGLDSSFAGQFKSFLKVLGTDAILAAIRSIWETAGSPAARSYLEKNGVEPGELQMAVIIQEMISPDTSGVAFSRNPVTGLDEVIVEAVKGSGETLVQDGVTPYRWINKWGTWTEKPAQTEIGIELIERVVSQTKAIAKAYGQAVDLEWVYDGHTLHWVQLREITSLDIPIYSNRISKEVFPGMIKPLIWSVNVPLVNGAWVRLFTELLGPNDLQPESLAGYFYYRAYFNMGALGQIFELMGMPRETLELLMGIEAEGPEKPSFRPTPKTYTLLPRMVRFGLDKARFARRLEAFLPAMQEQLQAFRGKGVSALSERELLHEIDQLYPLAQEIAYYNIVTPLLMQVYIRILKGQLGRSGADLERLDLTGGSDEFQQFEPNVHLARLHRQYDELDPEVKAQISGGSYGQFRQVPGIESLQEGVAQFLEEFGHLSDSGNDFSHVPWRENPDLVLRIIVNHVPMESRSGDRVRFRDLALSPLRRPVVQPVYQRARDFLWYREAVSSLYTYGYGLFRIYFLALGHHLVRRGVLASEEDVFYLTWEEVRGIVDNGQSENDYQGLVKERKREIEQVEDIVLPNIIYGDTAPAVETAGSESLKGVPTSRGQYTGPVKVLQGIEDLAKLEEGDVLVIPYSDVGWTPLFTKAGAVIAESGGILSHSSIVAREYGIPAVVSVPGACRLADNTVVTVDGYRGEIVVRE